MNIDMNKLYKAMEARIYKGDIIRMKVETNKVDGDGNITKTVVNHDAHVISVREEDIIVRRVNADKGIQESWNRDVDKYQVIGRIYS